MGCTGSKSDIESILPRRKGKLSIGRWARGKLSKFGVQQSNRMNVSGILSKTSPNPAEPRSPRPKSKLEVTMVEILHQMKSEETQDLDILIAENTEKDVDDIIDQKIKLWQMESCLKASNCRPQAAKGQRKPVCSNHSDSLMADVRKLEQDMDEVIDGKNDVKPLSFISGEKRVRLENDNDNSPSRVASANDFCISQISNDRRVRPKAAHGFRTPNTVVSAVEYVLPGAVLDLSHLSVNGSKAKQDQCLLSWMERQESKDAQK